MSTEEERILAAWLSARGWETWYRDDAFSDGSPTFVIARGEESVRVRLTTSALARLRPPDDARYVCVQIARAVMRYENALREGTEPPTTVEVVEVQRFVDDAPVGAPFEALLDTSALARAVTFKVR